MEPTNQTNALNQVLSWILRWALRAYWGLVIVTFLAGMFTVYTYTYATMRGWVWDLQIYPQAITKGR